MLRPDWMAPLPGIGLKMEELHPQSPCLAAWPDRALESRLPHLTMIPVQLSELYQLVNQLPLFVCDGALGPQLMAELRPSHLVQPAFDSSRRWRAGPLPQTARLLPFLAQADGTFWRIEDQSAPPDHPRDDALRQRLLALLAIQSEGLRRISQALRFMIASGILMPEPATGIWQPVASQSDDPDDTAELASRIDHDCGAEFYLALRLWAALTLSARHRRAETFTKTAAPQRPLSAVLGQDAALKRADFLSHDRRIDFSALAASPPKAPGTKT